MPQGFGAVLAAALLSAAGCADDGSRTATRIAFADAPRYARDSSLRCVRRAGGVVSRVRRTDDRRADFADLAQQTSREVRLRGASVLVAFERNAAAADLLVQTLRVPADPYRLERRANVVLMYKPVARPVAVAVTRCLRRRR